MIKFEYISGEIDGIKTLFVVPAIPDTAPADVREGIARRRLATINGLCSCGGRRAPLTRSLRRRIQRESGQQTYSADVVHTDDCAAISVDVQAYIRGWRRSP